MPWKFYLFLQDSLAHYLNDKDYELKTEITELSDNLLNEQNKKKGAYISAMVRKYQIPKVDMKWTEEEGAELELIQRPIQHSKKVGFETFMKYRVPVKGNVMLLQFRTKKVCRPEYCLKALVEFRAKMVTMESGTIYENSTKLPKAKLKEVMAEAQKRANFMQKSVKVINDEIDKYNQGLIEKAINLYEERYARAMTSI
jgi:hypothetical protein